jgi:hypothetical protein
VPASLKPVPSKSALHLGDKAEKTAERIARRADQAVETLKAFIASDRGFTDQELAAGSIGGADGARRKRFLRSEWGLDFTVRTDTDTGLKRYSLADKEHAKKTLAAEKKVDPLL